MNTCISEDFTLLLYIPLCHTLSTEQQATGCIPQLLLSSCRWPICGRMERGLTSPAGTNAAGQLLLTKSNKLFPVFCHPGQTQMCVCVWGVSSFGHTSAIITEREKHQHLILTFPAEPPFLHPARPTGLSNKQPQ